MSTAGSPHRFARVVRSADVPDAPRYVLVTQCLQNDFFQNADCRLGLPPFVVHEMLLGKNRFDAHTTAGAVRRAAAGRVREMLGGKIHVGDRSHVGAPILDRRTVERGPLGRLLAATIDERARGVGKHTGILHVINIRDWHVCTSRAYEDERRIYGRHCEEETWGAAYVDGLAQYLDPHVEADAAAATAPAKYFAQGSVRIYHIHSDTLYDFKPHKDTSDLRRTFRASELEDYLDVIVEGSNDELDELHKLLEEEKSREEVHAAVVDAMKSEEPWHPPVHLAAIGVYTDIKIKTILTGVKTRYDLDTLAVSDTFTTSPTLERHLAGLDYAKKVLGVEVIHGINDLVHFLGGSGEIENESSLVAAERYAAYERFFQDQQNVLAHQNQQLREYLALTEHRAARLYDTINRANRFLLYWGETFLATSLVFGVLSAVWPGQFDWKFSAITGGLGVAQFVGVFFTKPTEDLQRNLRNLVGFKMVLESHSLKAALMRFHLTTARTLRPIENEDHKTAALRQIHVLDQQLEMIGKADAGDFAHLEALGYEFDHLAASDGRGNGNRVDGDAEASAASDVRPEASRAKAD